MKLPHLGAEQSLVVGTKTVIESDAPEGSHGVAFEDDGDTGYFYARDFTVPDRTIVDALHIYNVRGITDRHKPCMLKIIWTQDYSAAALLINLVPHAVFHFGEQCGYADDPYPSPIPNSGWIHSSDLIKTRDLFFPPSVTKVEGAQL